MKTDPTVTIPIPVHPDDQQLPCSLVRFQLSRGIFEAYFPIQGVKTIETMIAILELWKPTLVQEEPERKPVCEDIALMNQP